MREMPLIGFGTYKHLGDTCVRSVSDALEIGYRHIDTAEMYGNEREVGVALASSGLQRVDYFVTTKIQPEHLGRGQVLPHAQASLERLCLAQVDLLLIHWPSMGQFELADYMVQLAEVKAKGLAKHIGVSNFTIALLDQAIAAVGADHIFTNQVEAHVLMQNKPIAAHARKVGIGITAYCPLARGKLAEAVGLQAIADRHSASLEQVGLAFLLAEGFVVIPSSTNRERIASNWAAQNLRLAPAEISAMRAMDVGKRLVDGSWAPKWDI